MKAEISVIYRAEVTVPDDFFEAHRDTNEYEQQSYRAGALVETSGQDRYSDCIEWGEGPTREECEAFIASWKEFLTKGESK